MRKTVCAVVCALTVCAAHAEDTNRRPIVTHAHTLSIERCDHVTTVTIENAWPGAQPLTYQLVHRSGGADAAATTASGMAPTIALPVRRIVSLATPVIAHLADLEVLDRVVAVDTIDWIYNRDIRARYSEGELVQVGSGADIDVERIISLEPDVVLMSPAGPDDPAIERLHGAGIPALAYADWREQSPLGRAEWVKLIGVLTGRLDRATEVFSDRVQRYESLVSATSDMPTDERPTIMANAPWQGNWPVPRGESYVAQLFADAGGAYLWADTSGAGSLFLDLEAVLARAAGAEYWINLNAGWDSRSDVTDLDPRLAAFAAFRTGRLYHYNGRVRESGANDFWESGATRPDLVIADLISILHPELAPDHEAVYYRRLSQ